MQKKILFYLIFQTLAFAQQTKISGFIDDNLNRGIESASVLILDESKNTLAYTFTKNSGYFELTVLKPDANLYLVASSLGFYKQTMPLDFKTKNDSNITIVLKESTETLKEVIIDTNPVKGDTTSFKTSKFINQTEQTVEDVLKKIPGIEVQKDGSIKAHGKFINKLLIEGEDVLDKNYKVLSRNLDAKVLDVVQILDNYEDNPIFKRIFNSSDKVAINLKLKKDKKNIWFGNLNVGAGVLSDNRWKESLNVGLIRKKIKLFYFADYNNLGEKSTDLITENSNENSYFTDERFEKTTKSLFAINSNENATFSKSQSVFNEALLNSISFTTKLQPNFLVRGVGFFTNDNQNQNSFSQTSYTISDNPITTVENSNYKNSKTLASIELEFKYYPNKKNYFTNLFIYKNNPTSIFNSLQYNDSQINQGSTLKNQIIFNHLHHTFTFGKNKVINNYFYFGNDKGNHQNAIASPLLNNYLSGNDNGIVNQNFKKELLYFGVKSKYISRFKKLDHLIDLNFENNTETNKNNFLVNGNANANFENNIKLTQSILNVGNTFRYNFNEKIVLSASLNYANTNFNVDENKNNISLLNPKIVLNIYKSVLGSFSFLYSKNSTLPEINALIKNPNLTNYRSFSKGFNYLKPFENDIFSFTHSLLNDKKRFAVNTSLVYSNLKTIAGTENTIDQNFIFSSYILTKGGKNYNGNFDYINYIRRLKTSFKIETNQNLSTSLINVNSNTFVDLKNYSSLYKFTCNTFLTSPFNFNFGFTLNYSKSFYNQIISKNNTQEAFFNINYNLKDVFVAEFNSTLYKINGNNYSFLNAVLNYNPKQSKLSYRMIFNNLINQNEFTTRSIDNYSLNKSTINLVPRYVLLNCKYRF